MDNNNNKNNYHDDDDDDNENCVELQLLSVFEANTRLERSFLTSLSH